MSTSTRTPPSGRPAPPPAVRRQPGSAGGARRPFGWLRLLRVVGVLVLVFLAVAGYSIGGALTRAGNDTTAARLAEWARDHHLNIVVTELEKLQYQVAAPTTGGVPKGGIPVTGATGGSNGSDPAPHTPPPARAKVLATGQPLPNEGVWQTVVTNAAGEPAVRVAYVRPDDLHTQYLAALMWLDPQLLSARLHPGYPSDPRGQFSTPNLITAAAKQTVAAAHNGGFRLNGASRGGYYDDGKVAVPLRDGAASIVILKDGTVRVGAWNRDVSMSASVRSVRQNLDLLVDKGQLNTSCSDNNSPVWGYTLGNNAYVPRTGFGIRADGALVYVNSPATSVCSIGRLLQSAGVVRGMELDINPEWAVGVYYTHDAAGRVVGHKLRPDQSADENHYYSTQRRDFFDYSLRELAR